MHRKILNTWINDSHGDRIHSSPTAVHCFDNCSLEKQPVAWKQYCAEHRLKELRESMDRCFDKRYVGKQPVAWKEYCVVYWLKELQESMDRCTGHRNITKILLKMMLITIQSINQSINYVSPISKANHRIFIITYILSTDTLLE